MKVEDIFVVGSEQTSEIARAVAQLAAVADFADFNVSLKCDEPSIL